MILVRTPFRISFVGGGSDIKSYYQSNPGAVISTSIDKYMYLSLHRKFDKGFRIAYSKIEDVNCRSQIKHPIVRNTLNLFNIDSDLEISAIADIPGKGTGLGSSSSYCISLIKAISEFNNWDLNKKEIAKFACKVEIEMCKEPIGKQDQYACALGGYNRLSFKEDGSVVDERISIDRDFRRYFETYWMIFYTGITRSTSDVLSAQIKEMEKPEKKIVIKEMVELVDPFVQNLKSGNVKELARLLDINWKLKKQMTSIVSNVQINQMYDTAISSGALSGKLLGAGAGGFLLLLVPPSKRSNVQKSLKNLMQVSMQSEHTGTSIIYRGSI